MKTIAVVGAGFSGAVIANSLANAGYHVKLFDSRDHIGGNCYTARDDKTGIMVHKYGPHIFHTNNQKVWNFINEFDEFVPFVNRVKAVSSGRIYSLPVNLLTINNFFDKNLSPSEAQSFIDTLSDKSISLPKSFEEQALKFVGRDIYEAFFKGYTEKQWGVHPSELPADILKRLPLRFNYDDNYYSSKFQGLPLNGYTYIFEKMLDHKNIELILDYKFLKSMSKQFDHVFYSGPIDEWFGFSEGRLRYRTLDFVSERHAGDYQGNPVINYCDASVPWTRITEHKHFSPWESHESTIIYKEFSRESKLDDIPYYPLRLLNDKQLLNKYIAMSNLESGVTFVGRLGTYRYLDMHLTIAEALQTVNLYLDSIVNGSTMPAFCVEV